MRPLKLGNRMFNGIASVIFPTSNLEVDKTFWQAALGVAPYFDEPFYVGYAVAGYELGLQSFETDNHDADNIETYWGVDGHEIQNH